MRRIGPLALALIAVAMTPPVAGALPLLSADDSADLAQALAEAQEEQGVCYGWTVTITDSPTDEVGSSTGGPGVPLDVNSCPKWAVLTANIVYEPEWSEDNDSARVQVGTNLPINFSMERIGLRSKDLLGDRDDASLIAMVQALPLIVAEDTDAPFVAFEPQAEPVAGIGPTNRPGSDWWRHYWPIVVLLTLLPLGLVGALLFMRDDLRTKLRTWIRDNTREDE